MTDENKAFDEALEILTSKTVEVDPRRLVLEMNLDLAAKQVDVTKASVERGHAMIRRMNPKSKMAQEKAEEMEFFEGFLYDAQKLLLERANELRDFDEADAPDITNAPSITIGFVPEAEIISYDVGEQYALGLPSSSRDRNKSFIDLDHALVKAGVCGHSGVMVGDVELPFGTDEHEQAADGVIDFYYRLGWLRALRWKIYRVNTLTEEKKSKLSPTSGGAGQTPTVGSAKA
jgi:hypothetical protein